MSRLGRALGGGRLMKQKRGKGDHAWLLDYKDGQGKRRRQMLSRDKRIAERLKADIIQKRDLVVAGFASVEGQSRDLSELKTLYLADLEARTRPTNYKKVKGRIERVLKLVSASRVRDLQPHMLLQYRTHRLKTGAAHSTINGEVSSTQALLRWGVRVGLIRENPIEHIPRLPLSRGHIRHQRRAMSDDEMQRFLEAAIADDLEQDARFAAVRTIEGGTKGPEWVARPRALRIPQAPMWLAFLEVGARYGELTQCTWGDVDLVSRTLTLRAENTKTGKARAIPLREGLMRELNALRALHREVYGRPLAHTDRVFLAPEGGLWPEESKPALIIFKRVLERAGIARRDQQGHVLDIHALRHTFATRLARAGVGLLQAQRLLGHADPAMTARVYTHLEVDDLRGAIKRLDEMEEAERPSVLRVV